MEFVPFLTNSIGVCASSASIYLLFVILIIGSYQRIVFSWNRSLRSQSAKFGIANALASEIYDEPCLLKIRAILGICSHLQEGIFENFCVSLSGQMSKTEPRKRMSEVRSIEVFNNRTCRVRIARFHSDFVKLST